MKNILNQLLPKIIEIRHDLHAHPELGCFERKTVEIISRVLEDFGFNVRQGIGKTGLVAVLDSYFKTYRLHML